jgi:hypothetical protein
VIEGDFQASNWLDLQRLHHNRVECITNNSVEKYKPISENEVAFQ